ncbi:hypothetical protein EHS39_14525 [Ensifer sp. MPMI2T]|nr:hypothetical protein EHS39_14525 [Ensifer sp. MPMI2T]
MPSAMFIVFDRKIAVAAQDQPDDRALLPGEPVGAETVESSLHGVGFVSGRARDRHAPLTPVRPDRLPHDWFVKPQPLQFLITERRTVAAAHQGIGRLHRLLERDNEAHFLDQ